MAQLGLDHDASTDAWAWPVRWDDAARLASLTAAPFTAVVRSPLLAAHRQIDRLSALARAVHRGEESADRRLREAIDLLRDTAPWLLEIAHEVEAHVGVHADCRAPLPGATAPAFELEGLLDDGGVSVLLAVAAGVVDIEATRLIVGLAVAAMAAEASIPGVSSGNDALLVPDLGVLQARSYTSGRSVGDLRAVADLTPFAPPVPMRTLSGSIGGPGGLPGLGEIQGLAGGHDLGDIEPGTGGPGIGGHGSNPFGGWRPKGPGGDDPFHFDPEIIDHRPILTWPPWNIVDQRQLRRIGCLLELNRLLVPEPQPERVPPGAPITWTTGIESVEVDSPCGSTPKLTIHGYGFGATQPAGVGVIASLWDAASKQVVCRPIQVLAWSDTTVVVQLPPDIGAGGVAGFADVAYIAAYDAWVVRENARVQGVLKAAACLGQKPPAGLVIRHPWSDCPPATPAASYAAGLPFLVVEIIPAGGSVLHWHSGTPMLEPNEPFRINWTTGNATRVHLKEMSESSGVLVAAGKPNDIDVAASGTQLLTASATPGLVYIEFTAANDCATVGASALAVIVGRALAPPTITVVAPIPGGDIDVVAAGGKETLQPDTRSIPLVAGKRTVVRVDWQIAVPQAPAGREVIVTASVWAKVPGYPGGPVTVELFPQANTALPAPAPADPPLELKPVRAFTSTIDYAFWQVFTAGNPALNPGTFNVVLPPGLAVGDVTLTAYVQARSPGTGAGGDKLITNTSAVTTVRFHQRRSIVFRYQRWGVTAAAAPADATCAAAMRVEGSLLPIPDPPIFALSANGVASDGQLIEDLFALKSATPGASGKEEIWFTMGNIGQGGYAPKSMPWCAATDPTRCVSAHEACHMFNQIHLNDPVCGPNDGDALSAFPDSGQVIVIGWDQWANQEIVRATDFMSYCWATAWMSPERWRRVFVEVGR